MKEMFLACNSILGGPHDGALIDIAHPSRSPTLQTSISSTVPLSYDGQLTFSDVAYNATREGIRINPNAFFLALFTG